MIERDVVIIGAGVTGLTAANRLVAEGRTVAVLEARDRVGGRTWTKDIEGVTLEIGGQWVSPDQTALLETLDELGLETYDRYREGSSVYIDEHGTRTEYTGDIFPLPEATAAAIEVPLIALTTGLSAGFAAPPNGAGAAATQRV